MITTATQPSYSSISSNDVLLLSTPYNISNISDQKNRETPSSKMSNIETTAKGSVLVRTPSVSSSTVLNSLPMSYQLWTSSSRHFSASHTNSWRAQGFRRDLEPQPAKPKECRVSCKPGYIYPKPQNLNLNPLFRFEALPGELSRRVFH